MRPTSRSPPRCSPDQPQGPSRLPAVLTDYHVHLRPDEPDTPPDRYFTADNVARYRAAADGAAVAELGISEHLHRFRQALEVWRHPFWVETAVDDLDEYCDFLASSGLRVGIEADYVRGAEEAIADLLGARRFDYVIGSVHFVGDGAVDHLGYDVWEIEGGDPDPRAHPSDSIRRLRPSNTQISEIPTDSMNSRAASYAWPTCSGTCASEESVNGTPASTQSSAKPRAG